jgi:uracil-DNA glycosylase
VISPFRQHVENWKNGCGSSICEGARKCIARGSVPCDVVFVGEAPGHSEQTLGQPFVGPAGQLLDDIIRKGLVGSLCVRCIRLMSWEAKFSPSGVKGRTFCSACRGEQHRPISYALTNLVCCIPYEEGTRKADKPLDEDIECCGPRLQEFVRICSPRLVVCVGALPRDWTDPKYHRHIDLLDANDCRIPSISIDHPAYILRANVAQKGYLLQKAVVTLRNGIEEYFSSGSSEDSTTEVTEEG